MTAPVEADKELESILDDLVEIPWTTNAGLAAFDKAIELLLAWRDKAVVAASNELKDDIIHRLRLLEKDPSFKKHTTGIIYSIDQVRQASAPKSNVGDK